MTTFHDVDGVVVQQVLPMTRFTIRAPACMDPVALCALDKGNFGFIFCPEVPSRTQELIVVVALTAVMRTTFPASRRGSERLVTHTQPFCRITQSVQGDPSSLV